MEEIELYGSCEDVELKDNTLKIRLHKGSVFGKLDKPILYIYAELAHDQELDIELLAEEEIYTVEIESGQLTIDYWFVEPPLEVHCRKIEWEWQPYSLDDYKRRIASLERSLQKQGKEEWKLSSTISRAIKLIDEETRRIGIKKEHEEGRSARRWYSRQQKLLNRVRNVLNA